MIICHLSFLAFPKCVILDISSFNYKTYFVMYISTLFGSCWRYIFGNGRSVVIAKYSQMLVVFHFEQRYYMYDQRLEYLTDVSDTFFLMNRWHQYEINISICVTFKERDNASIRQYLPSPRSVSVSWIKPRQFRDKSRTWLLWYLNQVCMWL